MGGSGRGPKASLRIRRLTLPPAGRGSNQNEPEISQEEIDDQWMLDKEHMARALELTMATSTSQRPHVHGVESWRGSRFWAISEEEDSDEASETESTESEVNSITSTELLQEAKEAGFTMSDIEKAVLELRSPSPGSKKSNTVKWEGSVAKRIIDTLVERRTSCKPWQGRLPPPRVSPLRTLGDALAQAKIQVTPTNLSLRSSLKYKKRCSSPSVSSAARQSPASAVTAAGSVFHGKSAQFTGDTGSNLNLHLNAMGRHNAIMGQKTFDIKAKIPYKPPPGLVALFARTGTNRQNPISLLTVPPPRKRSYAKVVRTGMENRDGKPNMARGDAPNQGSQRGRGNGQAGGIGHGGFQHQSFHPGYGGRGIQGGHVGGRYYQGNNSYGRNFRFHRNGYPGNDNGRREVKGAEHRPIPNPPRAQGDTSGANQQTQPQAAGSVDISTSMFGNLPVQAAALLQQALAAAALAGQQGLQQKQEGKEPELKKQ